MATWRNGKQHEREIGQKETKVHQNDINPSIKPKKAIQKRPNKHRKVWSGLQSVFQSRNYQVCDASKRHQPFYQAKESNPETSEQTSEGLIRSPKCVSITELSGLWCIKTTSPFLLSQRKQSRNVRTNIGRSDQVSTVFFNHGTIRSVMHQNDITPSIKSDQVSKVFFNHGTIRSVMHQNDITSKVFFLSGLWCIKTTSPLLLSQRKQSRNVRTNIGRSDQVSKVFFNHGTIRSVMHQNDINLSIKPKKAIQKRPNKHRKVWSGLQSVFQSRNYQVCDASKRHHPFYWAKESNPQTSEQTSEGLIRSPKCFSITELSGLWCIKTTSTFLLSQRKQSRNVRTNIGRSDQVSKVFFNHGTIRSVMHQNDITPSIKPKKAIQKRPNKHRKVWSGLQSVFQSRNYQVCDASKRHHPFY